MIDLHFHSTFSDGKFTPEELADKVKAIGLQAVSLTDHDTTSGSQRFKNALEGTDIEVISGVELSVEPPDENSRMTIHMLGYFIDNNNVTTNVAIDAITAHICVSAYPLLDFCVVIPVMNTNPKTNNSRPYIKDGTAVATSTNVSSIPPVKLGCKYILILIWVPLPCFPYVKSYHPYK